MLKLTETRLARVKAKWENGGFQPINEVIDGVTPQPNDGNLNFYIEPRGYDDGQFAYSKDYNLAAPFSSKLAIMLDTEGKRGWNDLEKIIERTRFSSGRRCYVRGIPALRWDPNDNPIQDKGKVDLIESYLDGAEIVEQHYMLDTHYNRLIIQGV